MCIKCSVINNLIHYQFTVAVYNICVLSFTEWLDLALVLYVTLEKEHFKKKNNSAESYLYECIRILFHSFVIESLKCVRLIYGTLHIVMALLIWQLEQINRVTNTVQ